MGGELFTRLPDELSERLQGYSSTRRPYDETQAKYDFYKRLNELIP